MYKRQTFWEEIRKICERRYKLIRSWESLRSKWREVQHETQQLLAKKDQNVERAQITGNMSEEALQRFCMRLYITRMIRDGKRSKPFRYFRTAEFLQNYPKFMSTKGVGDVYVGMGPAIS